MVALRVVVNVTAIVNEHIIIDLKRYADYVVVQSAHRDYLYTRFVSPSIPTQAIPLVYPVPNLTDIPGFF